MFTKSSMQLLGGICIAVAAVAYGGYSLTEGGHNANGAYSFLQLQPSDGYSDMLYNWDHNQQTGLPPYPGPNTVDWPVNMIFWNLAEIDLVKALYNTQNWCGAAKHLLFNGNNPPGYSNDPQGFFWDTDSGTKDYCAPSCLSGPAYHMRVYADPPGGVNPDQMYNTGIGFWIAGTTHKDANEVPGDPCNKWHGYSEQAEDEFFVPEMEDQCGSQYVYEDVRNFYNEKYAAEVGDHIIYNNGRSSWVYITFPACW